MSYIVTRVYKLVYTTVYHSNPCIQLNFSKKKYKKVSGYTILQIKGRIKEPHSESEQILVKNLQDKPTVGWVS